jgi:hypothetical protein
LKQAEADGARGGDQRYGDAGKDKAAHFESPGIHQLGTMLHWRLPNRTK